MIRELGESSNEWRQVAKFLFHPLVNAQEKFSLEWHLVVAKCLLDSLVSSHRKFAFTALSLQRSQNMGLDLGVAEAAAFKVGT